ncbi:MAG: biopolymer transporter ExbD [bacterium]
MLKKREREKIIAEINITPLTDVMLVLLVIFMVTTPFIIQGNIKINLPSAKAPSDEMLEDNIVAAVSQDGKVFVNGVAMADDDMLLNELRNLMKKSGNRRVIIEGDKNSLHGNIVKIMGIAKEAGADKLAISTIPDTAGAIKGHK